jgi:hypothetical protein
MYPAQLQADANQVKDKKAKETGSQNRIFDRRQNRVTNR